MGPITPHLWFDGNAEEAVDYYVSIFPDSRIDSIAHYTDAGPGPKGQVMSIGFTLRGQKFACVNGGPMFRFNEALSLLIWCDSQQEIDQLYGALKQGGTEQNCGWVKDRYGLVWQVNYSGMTRFLASGDEKAAARAMQAMMTMKKIDVSALEKAFAG